MARASRIAVAALFAIAIWVGLGVGTAWAGQPLSPEMRAIQVEDHRGQQLDLDLKFVDHTGKTVTLRDYFDGQRAVIITLNYYKCRVLCAVQLSGLAETLSNLDWIPGDDHFRVVTLSIDPREKPADAAPKRASMLDVVDQRLPDGSEPDWAYLTGDVLSIKALAAQLGVNYAYDAEQDQYAHPGVLMFVTPDGRIAQYVYGLTFIPRDIKFGVMEAGEGTIGNPVEQIFLSCFHYDATIGRYGPFAFGIMRVGGTLTALAIAILIFVLWRQQRRRAARSPGDPRAPNIPPREVTS